MFTFLDKSEVLINCLNNLEFIWRRRGHRVHEKIDLIKSFFRLSQMGTGVRIGPKHLLSVYNRCEKW